VENRVHSWAEEVSANLEQFAPEKEDAAENTADEARTAHFDRPLKDIRVGESPSRPWGISVPAKYVDNESSSSAGSAPTASPPLPFGASKPEGPTPQMPSKCPFDHRALNKAPEAKQNQETQQPEQTTPTQPNEPQQTIPPKQKERQRPS
jgi:hypothetical protein